MHLVLDCNVCFAWSDAYINPSDIINYFLWTYYIFITQKQTNKFNINQS